MRRILVVALGAFAATGCGDALLGPRTSSSNAAVFDDSWTATDQHYSFFEYKHVDWDSLRNVYRPQALAAPNDAALAQVIGGMLGALRDVHVSLQAGGRTIRYLCRWDTAQTYFNSALVQTRYLTHATTTPHLLYGYAAPAVGYLRISDFLGAGWAGDVDEALRTLDSAKTLIVDIRENYGGATALAVAVAGRFADAPHDYGYIRLRNGPKHGDFTNFIAEHVAPVGRHFAGSVFVLTNRRVFSSAEDFVLAMRTFPNVTVVGDTTAGASGGPLTRSLPNGWTLQISEWMEYTPGHRPFEGVGLAPDLVTKSSASALRTGSDPVLDRALAMARP